MKIRIGEGGPGDALRVAFAETIPRHLVQPLGAFRAHELVDDLVDLPEVRALLAARAAVTIPRQTRRAAR